MTRPMGVGASSASGCDRTTSPRLMCGSIEPLWTTEPVSPNSIGARAQAVEGGQKHQVEPRRGGQQQPAPARTVRAGWGCTTDHWQGCTPYPRLVEESVVLELPLEVDAGCLALQGIDLGLAQG